MSGLSAGSSSRTLSESWTRRVDLSESDVTLATEAPWTVVRMGVDTGEAQNAKNQRVVRFIPWT